MGGLHTQMIVSELLASVYELIMVYMYICEVLREHMKNSLTKCVHIS